MLSTLFRRWSKRDWPSVRSGKMPGQKTAAATAAVSPDETAVSPGSIAPLYRCISVV